MKYLALPLVLMLLFFAGCDLLDDDDDDSSDGGTEVVATSDTSSSSSSSSSTASTTSTATTNSSTVVLNASSDFSCTSNWTTRDGAWGLKARTNRGSCQTSFPGESGNYRVVITVQTEFDGNSPYVLYINGNTAASGTYPLAPGCEGDCHPDNWRSQCPDRKRDLSAGTHSISKGETIKFYGEEDWNCDEHGAYAKWHKITFTRI
ncbi:MAG: hypothetical protein Q3M24_11250 [Candidatus Electrothrix aestuarii]|uniref:Uncharacterized protein n=1 Tax=Candidatus Electrothrix aestuarii TaxID=3062594 RepID=A0AAU8M1W2_9BACT|nr:hypothetical protein [Candidatus Electrothrix aestuarii]WPD24219.1 MAG: hypothetical protein SD837_06595 [Candidatus Electrothrix sp. GW3-3]